MQGLGGGSNRDIGVQLSKAMKTGLSPNRDKEEQNLAINNTYRIISNNLYKIQF